MGFRSCDLWSQQYESRSHENKNITEKSNRLMFEGLLMLCNVYNAISLKTDHFLSKCNFCTSISEYLLWSAKKVVVKHLDLEIGQSCVYYKHFKVQKKLTDSYYHALVDSRNFVEVIYAVEKSTSKKTTPF